MQADDEVEKILARFETVEQFYDGLGGKLIPWTKEHGGTSDDPSAQVFVVGVDGEVVARAPDSTAYHAKALAEWLAGQAAAWERAHPRTALPLVRAEVALDGEGEEAAARCVALQAAKKERKPALLYFGRDSAPEGERKLSKEVAAARKFEEKTLDSKSAAEAAEGWVLLRFDLADPAHAKLAATLGVEAAPAVVLVVPGEEQPIDLGDPAPGSLRYQLRKHGPSDR